MFKRGSILIYALLMMGLVASGYLTVPSAAPSSYKKDLKIELNRGEFTVFDFPSRKPVPSALLLFGSGDGGWNDLEEAIAEAFQNQGYEVVGIDSQVYAQTEYSLDILQSDYGKIAQTMLGRSGSHPPPLIVGGYSMGAAQAIAVAGGPHPPQGLIGLLVIDALSRGRYGLHSSDQLNILPKGPGTFGVATFSHTMDSLRVVQWHGENDPIDSHEWLNSLTAPHHFFTFPGAGHDYGINREEFLVQLVKSAGWIVNPMSVDGATAKISSSL